MTVQSRSIIKNIKEGKSSANSKNTKNGSSSNGSQSNSKTGLSPRSNSNIKSNDKQYVKIGEVFDRDKVKQSNNKTTTPNKKKIDTKRKIIKVEESDEEVNLIADMTESEKRKWVEDYLSQLPNSRAAGPVFSDMKLKGEEKGDGENILNAPYSSLSQVDIKSDFFNSPYIVSNVINFSKKNLSFNKYQSWKIRRENLKICEKIKSLQKRKLSTEYYLPSNMKSKVYPNSKAINRVIENRRIHAENMTGKLFCVVHITKGFPVGGNSSWIDKSKQMMRYMINKIKRTPNKKAPWYIPEDVRYIKT